MSAFARDSAGTKLVSLGPDDFNPSKVGPDSREPWFVDFFAPVSYLSRYRSILKEGWLQKRGKFVLSNIVAFMNNVYACACITFQLLKYYFCSGVPPA